MNKSSVLLLALFSTFSSHANVEWTYLARDKFGHKIYVDYDRISKKNGFTYFWNLTNFIEPQALNTMSLIGFNMLDCKMPRQFTILQVSATDQYFGDGNGTTSFRPPENWVVPLPETVMESLLNEVCKR